MFRDAPLDEATGLPQGAWLQAIEITPRDAADAVASGGMILVDIREPEEVAIAPVPGAVHIPMGDLATRIHEIDADEETPIGVICHHGIRSFKATLFLQREGLEGARSVAGGTDLWSRAVDSGVARY